MSASQVCLPFSEKYRPADLRRVAAQEDVISTLQKYIDKGDLPHMLFFGPPGCGKTTTICAVARRLYGAHQASYVLELNASDDRGIDVVREQIKSFASVKAFEKAQPGERSASGEGASGGRMPSFKLVILDEADQMTSAAQGALRRIMEQFSKNVRFCIICNFRNKVISPIASRCIGFRFPALPRSAVVLRLSEVAERERLSVTREAVEELAEIGNGDMRKALNVLQAAALSYAGREIDAESVRQTIGLPSKAGVEELLGRLLEGGVKDMYGCGKRLVGEEGCAAADVIKMVERAVHGLDWPEPVAIQLAIRLGEIEERAAAGASDAMHLAALAAAFVESRRSLEKLGGAGGRRAGAGRGSTS